MAPTPKGSVNVWPELATGVVPAVATDPTISVPLLEAWDVESIEVELVADANAANRDLQIIVTDSTGVEISRGPVDGTSITANQTVKYHLAQFGTVPADTSTNHFDKHLRSPPRGVMPKGKSVSKEVRMEISADTQKPVVLEVEGTRVKIYPSTWLVPEPLKVLKGGFYDTPPKKERSIRQPR